MNHELARRFSETLDEEVIHDRHLDMIDQALRFERLAQTYRGHADTMREALALKRGDGPCQCADGGGKCPRHD